MSSLHQDRSLVEGSTPATRVPSQRQGKASRTGSEATAGTAAATRARRTAGAKAATGALAARARAAGTATAKAATKAAASPAATAAKAATRKAATAGTAKARAATVKAATATKAAAAARAAGRASTRSAQTTTAGKPAAKATSAAKPATAAKPAAKPVAKAAPAAKPAAKATPAAKPAAKATPAAKPATAEKPAATTKPAATATRRPTPRKRPVVVDVAAAEPAETPTAVAPTKPRTPPVDAVVADGRRPWLGRRLPASPRRRPTLLVAAALVGALGVGLVAADEPAARAGTATVSSSISVAEQLGITADDAELPVTAADTARLEELAASRSERDAEQAAAAKAQAEADRLAAEAAAEAARPKAVLPVKGARLTSGFGSRWGRLHAGIDLAAPMMTPEYAVMDGIVLEAGPASGYGNVVYLQHENGDVTVYGHMEEILVEPGQVVRAGDTIALLGNRGRSTGPHLHFEVIVGGLNGKKIDPIPWLEARGLDL